MKKLNDFEEQLRKAADLNEEHVNTEDLWSKVEPHLKKPRRQRRGIVWFFIGIGLMAFLLYNIEKDTFMNDLSDDQMDLQNDISSLVVDKSAPNKEGSTTQHSTSLNLETEPPVKGIIEGHVVIMESNVASGSSGNQDIKGEINSGIQKVLAKENSPVKLELVEKNIVQNKEASEIAVGKLALENKSKDVFNIYFESDDHSGLVENSLFEDPISVPTLNITPLLIESKVVTPGRNLVTGRRNYTFDKWSISITGGYSNTVNSLGTIDAEWNTHLANRIEAESNLASWHFRTGISYALSEKWSIKGGIIYSDIYSRSSSILQFKDSVDVENVIVHQIVGPEGVENITGSVRLLQETTTIVERINRQKIINGELSLLRHLRIGGSSKLHLGLGLNYNLKFDQKGYIHPDGQSEYSLENDVNGWYKHRLNWGIQTEIGYSIPLSDFVKFEAYGLYNHSLSNWNTDIYRINERRSIVHLGVGCSFVIN